MLAHTEADVATLGRGLFVRHHSERLTAVKSKEHFSAVLFEGVRSADPPTISGYSLASAFSTTPEEERVATSLPDISGRHASMFSFRRPSMRRISSAY